MPNPTTHDLNYKSTPCESNEIIYEFDSPQYWSNWYHLLDIHSEFEKLKSDENKKSHKYFIDEFHPSKDFWIAGVDSPSGVLSGICRFHNSFEVGISEYFGNYLKNIPDQLKSKPNFICLESDSTNPKRKKPHLIRGAYEGDELSPKNWVGFSGGMIGECGVTGIAYVMDGREVCEVKKLLAITISMDSGYTMHDMDCLWIALGKPYFECSFDGSKWTFLGLASQPVPTYESEGIKIWTEGGFVELCGLGARGHLKDITNEVLALHAYRFPSVATRTKSLHADWPETPRNIELLKEQLKYINADCHYESYMRVVWAILSTGWKSSDKLAKEWSQTAPHRFDQRTFDVLVSSYDPHRPSSPSLGTIYHLARKGGWNG